MKSLTKFLTAVALALGLTACGSPGFIGTNSQQQQGSNGNFQTGILSFSGTTCGLIGGAPSLEIQGRSYYIGGDTPQQVSETILQFERTYGCFQRINVRFSGQVIQGRCPFNPTAPCTVVQLQQIQKI